MELTPSDLHHSISHPLVASVRFLNEIRPRYADAISFAPGAPHEALVRDIDVDRYLKVYVDAAGADGLFQYGPAAGIVNDIVAESLAADLRAPVAAEEVVITVGCQEALHLVFRVLCRDRADVVGVVEPAYVGATGAALALDVPVVVLPDNGGSPVGAAIGELCRDAAVRGGRLRAVYIAPDFSNPSGESLSIADRWALLAAADQHDFFVVEDSAYGFTADPASTTPSLKSLDRSGRVVHVGTFAKVAAPGARVGYVVASARVNDGNGASHALARDIAALKGMVTLNTSPVMQALVAGMLLEHGGSLRALGGAAAALYRRNMAALLAALDRTLPPHRASAHGVSWNRPTGGFFVRMRLAVPADEALLERAAREFGVLWTPMRWFYVSERGENEIRLSCSSLDVDEIDEGVRRLARFVEAVTPPRRRARSTRRRRRRHDGAPATRSSSGRPAPRAS